MFQLVFFLKWRKSSTWTLKHVHNNITYSDFENLLNIFLGNRVRIGYVSGLNFLPKLHAAVSQRRWPVTLDTGLSWKNTKNNFTNKMFTQTWLALVLLCSCVSEWVKDLTHRLPWKKLYRFLLKRQKSTRTRFVLSIVHKLWLTCVLSTA